MAQVTVRVGGYSHPVSCEDGQEAHLVALAAELDRRVSSIRAMGGQYGESRLLLLAGLLLADELHDMRLELAAARAGLPMPAAAPPAADRAPDPQLADRLARLADRIEGIAATLDRA